MSAVSALTLKEPIIPIVSSFDPANVRTAKVEHEWTTGGANPRDEFAKMYLPVCDDPSQKELFLYVVDQFMDATHDERLHLSTGPIRYTKFRIVLSGALRISWQTISDGRANKTVNTFAEDLRALVGMFLAPASRDDQLEYMRSITKPFTMSCETLGARIQVVSRLGRFLPGSFYDNDYHDLYETPTAYKRAYFMLMPTAFKIKFAENGSQLDNDACALQNLIRFMAIQEAISKGRSSSKRRYEGSSGGNRSRPRLGGGSGRGGFGRGSFGGRGSPGGFSYGSSYGRGRGFQGNYNYSGGMYQGAPANRWGWSGQGRGRGQSMSAPTTPRSPAARGGRMVSTTGRGGSSYGRGSGSYYGRGPRYATAAPGAGPAPSVPNFMVDQADQYYHDDGGHEQYYQEEYGPEDHYYQDGGDYQAYDEQYYGDHASGQGESYQGESTTGAEEKQEAQESEGQDAHWLEEFGM